MTYEAIISLTREAFFLVVIVAGPPLAAGLVVGVLVSVLQAITQVNEQTLAFVPKIVAMLAAVLVSLPWAMQRLVGFTTQIFELIARSGGGAG